MDTFTYDIVTDKYDETTDIIIVNCDEQGGEVATVRLYHDDNRVALISRNRDVVDSRESLYCLMELMIRAIDEVDDVRV